MENYSEKFL